jgi:hypothetical protein
MNSTVLLVSLRPSNHHELAAVGRRADREAETVVGLWWSLAACAVIASNAGVQTKVTKVALYRVVARSGAVAHGEEAAWLLTRAQTPPVQYGTPFCRAAFNACAYHSNSSRNRPARR